MADYTCTSAACSPESCAIRVPAASTSCWNKRRRASRPYSVIPLWKSSRILTEIRKSPVKQMKTSKIYHNK